MADSEAFQNSHAALVSAAWPRFSLHTGDPGTTGAAELSGGGYAQQTTTWGTAAGGEVTGSEMVFSVPSGATVTHWGQRRPDGTFGRGGALPVATPYPGAGVYRLTPTMDASA